MYIPKNGLYITGTAELGYIFRDKILTNKFLYELKKGKLQTAYTDYKKALEDLGIGNKNNNGGAAPAGGSQQPPAQPAEKTELQKLGEDLKTKYDAQKAAENNQNTSASEKKKSY